MDLTIESLRERYQDKSGILDLGKMLSDADTLGIKAETISHNYKKLTKFVLPNGMKFYAKPTSYKGASAEKVISEIYKNTDIVVPNTTIALMNGDYYTVTNDVLPSETTVQGEPFLKNITPAGAQYALPHVFGEEEPSPRVMSYFDSKALEQIAEHYGLALATKNWDANIGGLGFTVNGADKNYATGLITMDFEESMEPERGGGYANPFYPRRIDEWELRNYYLKSNLPFLKKGVIANKIERGANQIDEIVKNSQAEGFTPDPNYVDKLKTSMDNTVDMLQR